MFEIHQFHIFKKEQPHAIANKIYILKGNYFLIFSTILIVKEYRYICCKNINKIKKSFAKNVNVNLCKASIICNFMSAGKQQLFAQFRKTLEGMVENALRLCTLPLCTQMKHLDDVRWNLMQMLSRSITVSCHEPASTLGRLMLLCMRCFLQKV